MPPGIETYAKGFTSSPPLLSLCCRHTVTGYHRKEPDLCSLLLFAHCLNQIKVMSLILTDAYMLGHSEATKGSPQSETDIGLYREVYGPSEQTSKKVHEEQVREQPAVAGTWRKVLLTTYDIINDTNRTSRNISKCVMSPTAMAFQHAVCRQASLTRSP